MKIERRVAPLLPQIRENNLAEVENEAISYSALKNQPLIKDHSHSDNCFSTTALNFRKYSTVYPDKGINKNFNF